ncbi:cytochrome c-type biogenesis protein [Azovibrio restrictus]|uniref:cytochrome c-type biogenesis protein n=1 Tax=Azovibrio restrictus TaxID=146938 RepID=UPI0026F07E2F|nr:cytochrome c-type biogenesis protein [Azovibrio restrictus]
MSRRLTFPRLLAVLGLALACQLGYAEEARPLADDPVAEKRLQAISAELRCLVCQNETIAGSNADLAKDLRREIRTMIQAGQSDQQILDFMVSRYGDFVLYRPPLKGTTILLWVGPLLFLGVGIIALQLYLRRRNRVIQETRPLTEEEARQAEALLGKPENRQETP